MIRHALINRLTGPVREEQYFALYMSTSTATRVAVSSRVAVRLSLLVLLLGILPMGFAA